MRITIECNKHSKDAIAAQLIADFGVSKVDKADDAITCHFRTLEQSRAIARMLLDRMKKKEVYSFITSKFKE